MTHKSTWKALERKAAAILNGKRQPNTGKGGVDVKHSRFAIECKLRAKLGFLAWFEQAKGYARGTDKIPLLICKQKGKHGEFAILRLSDFEQLLGENDNGQ